MMSYSPRVFAESQSAQLPLTPDRPLEIWAGVECTYNRVRDDYFDQLEFSGHAQRPGDIDLIADLGVRTVRYPVLWERIAQHDGAAQETAWHWLAQRLKHLRRRGIRPIAGLLHHGSGPRNTSLVQPDFAHRLASFAWHVAARFPWIDAYTPVNEPLTTARFSTLYGHWYPHLRDPRAFAQAMVEQTRATVLAMEAIRTINPAAQLVQTEELGRIHGPPELQYQVDFENARRWLTLDLLLGRVDRHHPLGNYFVWLGIPEDDLRWFQDHVMPPDVIGLNYYLTSERYLDTRIERYAAAAVGGNGRHSYVDVEAIRILSGSANESTQDLSGSIQGPGGLLQEIWERYHVPVAITEVHLGCSREEQLRWLWSVWQAAQQARSRGANVPAVTCWSLFGTFDWDSLVTLPRGHYEPGAFDVRCGTPRPTAISRLVRELASNQEPSSPLAYQPGWWQRPERFLFPTQLAETVGDTSEYQSPPLLITGAAGTLGQALVRACEARSLAYQALNRSELDITRASSIAEAVERFQPWAVVNAAGFVRVDAAETERRQCMLENVYGPLLLAQVCAQHNLPLVTFSSDLVFDGQRQLPYQESDTVRPLSVYGRTKARADRLVMSRHPRALILRTSAFFGPWDEHNFVTHVLRQLHQHGRAQAAEDQIVSPTYVPDLVHATLDLLIDGATGIWHLANQGQTSWAGLARMAAVRANWPESAVRGCSGVSLGWSAARPPYSVLGTERGVWLPTLDDALNRYFQQRIQPIMV